MDLHRRPHIVQSSENFMPCESPHMDVKKQQIGLDALDRIDRCDSVSAPADHFDDLVVPLRPPGNCVMPCWSAEV
jgi:hypothetical protein